MTTASPMTFEQPTPAVGFGDLFPANLRDDGASEARPAIQPGNGRVTISPATALVERTTMQNKSETPGNVEDVAQPTSEAPLAVTHGSDDRSKFKVDFFTPAIPAMCLIQGVLMLKSKSDSLPEMLANLILGMALIYIAFLSLVNAMRRNHQNDPS